MNFFFTVSMGKKTTGFALFWTWHKKKQKANAKDPHNHFHFQIMSIQIKCRCNIIAMVLQKGSNYEQNVKNHMLYIQTRWFYFCKSTVCICNSFLSFQFAQNTHSKETISHWCSPQIFASHGRREKKQDAEIVSSLHFFEWLYHVSLFCMCLWWLKFAIWLWGTFEWELDKLFSFWFWKLIWISSHFQCKPYVCIWGFQRKNSQSRLFFLIESCLNQTYIDV